MSKPVPESDGRERLPGAYDEIDQGMRAGLHLGAQVFVSLESRVVADFGVGLARMGVPMSADTIMLWLSSGKPLAAAAIMQLREQGKLAFDDPVVKYIPEFAPHGKDAVTIEHLLVHTGGFRWADVDPFKVSWEETIARICAARLEPRWVPGQQAGYHTFTSWYILGEIVRRVDGRPYSAYARQQLLLPLGMRDSWLGIPPADYLAYGDRMGIMLQTDKQPPQPNRFESPEAAAIDFPGGNARGPMHDLGRFYQMLLAGGELDGVRVLTDESVWLLTTPRRVGMFDETFKHVMDWSLGLIVNSGSYAREMPYGYGAYSSPRTFGHSGAQSSTGFADPDRRLVVAVVFNGMPGEARHEERMRRFLAALYEDLGFA